MESLEENKIVIDLTQSMNSRFFEGSDIIHKIEFNKAITLIGNKINEAKKYALSSPYFCRDKK